MNRFQMLQPTSIESVAPLLGEPGTVAMAAGIDLLDRMKEGTLRPTRVVNLKSLAGLRYVRRSGDHIEIGATATIAMIAEHPEVQRHLPAVAQAAASLATPQIRNVATAAGDLLQRPRCWYFRSADFVCLKKGGDRCFAAAGDNRYHAILGGGPSYIVHPSTLACALVAMDAQLVIRGASERTCAIDGFFALPAESLERENRLAPDEIITAIRIPIVEHWGAYAVAKEREVYDWPLGEVAVTILHDRDTVQSARIVLGAAAPIPWRAQAAEASLRGKPLNAQTAKQAAHLALGGARPLLHNAYKIAVLTALVERALLAARGAA